MGWMVYGDGYVSYERPRKGCVEHGKVGLAAVKAHGWRLCSWLVGVWVCVSACVTDGLHVRQLGCVHVGPNTT